MNSKNLFKNNVLPKNYTQKRQKGLPSENESETPLKAGNLIMKAF